MTNRGQQNSLSSNLKRFAKWSNCFCNSCLWLYFLFFFMRRRIEKAHGHWTKFDYYTMTCFCRSSTTTMTISVLHIHIESSKRKKPSEIRWNISLSFEIFLGNKKCFLQTQTNYVFLPVILKFVKYADPLIDIFFKN